MSARPRLTYANVVSTLALVIAMSAGGAYAASVITTSDIRDGAVTTPKIRDAAVTPAKIATDAVRRAKLADGAVGATELADGAVGAAELAAGAVTRSKIATNAVAAGKVEDGSLGSAEIEDESLTGDDIANGLIRGEDIWDGTIAAQDLQVWARQPVAYAHVHADGYLIAGTNGFTDEMFGRAVDTEGAPKTGIYCIRLLPEAPNAVSVTGSTYQVGPTIPNARLGKADEGCPDGTQVTVFTYGVQGGVLTLTNGAFFFNGWP